MSQPQLQSSANAETFRYLMAGLCASHFVSGLSPAAIADIATESTVSTSLARSDVFREGDQCAGLWILLQGRVRLQHMSVEGRFQATGFRAMGDVLEVAPVIDGSPHMATAVALEDAILALIPRNALTRIGQRHPETTRNLIELLCAELRQRDIASGVAALKDARGRIGCTLLQLMREYGVQLDSGVRINYRVTRQDIADRSGVTIETSVRLLSDLQRKGVLRTERQIIDVLDVPMLQQMTGCAHCQFDCAVFAPLRGRRHADT